MKPYIIVFFLVLPLLGFSQNYNFRPFSLEQGLSQSQIFDICQDPLGNLWFATYGGGITIYDGVNIKYLNKDNGLPSNLVLSLFLSSDKTMWIGTDNGLAYYKGNKIEIIDSTIDNNFRVWNLAEDQYNNLWIGCEKGLYQYRQNKIISFDYKLIKIPSFIKTKNNQFYIGGLENGIAIFDGKQLNFDFANDIDNQVIFSLFEDHKNNIWVATTSGVFIVDAKTQKTNTYEKLKDISIQCINQNLAGNMLFGSEVSGVFFENENKLTNIKDNQGIGYNIIEDIFIDNAHNIWIATDGAGASLFNGFSFHNYDFHKLIANNFIWSVAIDHKNQKWFGTDGHGVIVYNEGTYKLLTTLHGLPSNHINRILNDSQNRIWLCTKEGVAIYKNGIIKTLSEKNGLCMNHIVSILEDKNKNIWLGTYGGGVSKYNGEHFVNYTKNDGLIDNYIWEIFEDNTGKIYFGTEEGLSVLDENKITNYTINDGLSDNSIWGIKQDTFNNIWLVTDNSLSWFNHKKFINHYTTKALNTNMLYSIDIFDGNNIILGCEKGIIRLSINDKGEINYLKHFGKDDGFKGIECNANALIKDKDGTFWFGTINGVSTYNPHKEFSNFVPPKINITDIHLFYKKTNWYDYSDSVDVWNHLPNNLALGYKENNLTFKFVGINYRHPNKVKYQYLLQGNDKVWHPSTTKNEATYTNIPPGNYSFLIKACNENNIWSTPISFSFIIEPPFWQKGYFFFIIFVFISLLIYLLSYIRTYRLNKLRIDLSNKVKERTTELNNQKEELQAAIYTINEQKEELEATLLVNQKQKERLEDANVEIQKSAKLKELFLANTSHEIRTPLNVINGYTNLLLNTNLLAKQKKYLKNIKISSNNLLIVINDILDISKIEAGKLVIENIEFDTHNIIRDLCTSLMIKAQEKSISLKYSIKNDVPKFVSGDPFRLTQILTNLILNAIKFTPQKGTVKLSVSTKYFIENKVDLVFEVTDNGIGIHSDKLKSIFKSFTQASSETTRKYGGTGLGLSIVKNLVTLQNGYIDVQSEVNKGTTFKITLRYITTSGKDIKKQETNYIIPKSKNLQTIKLLLVEDNPLNVTLAIDTILMYNNKTKIDVATNGKHAISMLLKNNYDLIIMDIQMPEMDGYDTTLHIRNKLSKPTSEIPILGMSAHTMKEEKEKCFTVGMNEYLTKPFIPKELFNKIDKLTKNSFVKDKNHSSNKKLNPKQLPVLNIVKIDKIAKFYNYDTIKIKKIIKTYTQGLPEIFNKLSDGVNNEDFKSVKTYSHSLKTSFQYIDASQSCNLLKEIELFSENKNNIDLIKDNFLKIKFDYNLIIKDCKILQQHFEDKLNEKI